MEKPIIQTADGVVAIQFNRNSSAFQHRFLIYKIISRANAESVFISQEYNCILAFALRTNEKENRCQSTRQTVCFSLRFRLIVSYRSITLRFAVIHAENNQHFPMHPLVSTLLATLFCRTFHRIHPDFIICIIIFIIIIVWLVVAHAMTFHYSCSFR